MPDLNRLSINQITTTSWSVPKAIAGYARAGVRGIGLWPGRVRDYGIANTRRALVEHGLTATSYCCGKMFVAIDKSDLAQQRGQNRRLIEETAELGATCLVCVSGGLPPGEKNLEDARRRTMEELALLLPIARAAGVSIGIEPIHPMKAAEVSSLTTLAEANALCDALGSGLGIIVDVYHVWWDPKLWNEIQRAGDRIVGFHLSDWFFESKRNFTGRAMMGDGVIDIPAIRGAAESAGYHGFYEIELVSEIWDRCDPSEVVDICVDRYVSHCSTAIRLE